MTSESNGPPWRKVLLIAIPMLVAGLLGYGALKSDVRHVEDTLSGKANRETVEAQYQAILRELQRINERLDQIRPR